MQEFGDILRNVTSRAAVVKVRNILNPLLWLSAIVTPVFFLTAYAAGFDTVTGACLTIIGSLPPILALFAYLYFALKEPDRLQSEEYRLEHRKLDIIDKAGNIKNIDLLPLESNPQIEANRDED